jgi:hypothetical protein
MDQMNESRTSDNIRTRAILRTFKVKSLYISISRPSDMNGC